MLKAQSKSVKVGCVGFACLWCGKWHKVNLYQAADEEPDDYGDVLVDPPANRLTCKCGADLLVLGEPSDFDVVWVNEKDMRLKAWLRLKPKVKPAHGGYYDLIRVPHGHIPVTKVFLWRRLPILVREIRGDDYFRCPECGAPSFFKVALCYVCLNDYEDTVFSWRNVQARARRRARKDYFRNIVKRLECLVLPVLVLLGRAWYVRSKRRHYNDWEAYLEA